MRERGTGDTCEIESESESESERESDLEKKGGVESGEKCVGEHN